MDPASLIIAIGGLVVAALGAVASLMSVWLGYKERSAVHRQALYMQQVEAFAAVIGALYTVYSTCFNFIETQPDHRLNSKTRPQLQKAIRGVHQEFENEYAKRLVLLPRAVISEIVNFLNIVHAISVADEDVHEYPSELVNSPDPQKDLSTGYNKVLVVAKQRLGVEPLSHDIEKIVGEGFPHT